MLPQQLIFLITLGAKYIDCTTTTDSVYTLETIQETMVCQGEITDINIIFPHIFHIKSHSPAYCGAHMHSLFASRVYQLTIRFQEGHDCSREHVALNGQIYCGQLDYSISVYSGVFVYVSRDDSEKNATIEIRGQYIWNFPSFDNYTQGTYVPISVNDRQYKHIRDCRPSEPIIENSIIHVNYESDRDCLWIVNPLPQDTLEISGHFSIEYDSTCNYDRLIILNGILSQVKCGPNIQLNNVYNNTNRIEIQFISDGSVERRDFDIFVRFLSEEDLSSTQAYTVTHPIESHENTTAYVTPSTASAQVLTSSDPRNQSAPTSLATFLESITNAANTNAGESSTPTDTRSSVTTQVNEDSYTSVQDTTVHEETPTPQHYFHVRACRPLQPITTNTLIHVRYLDNQNCTWIIHPAVMETVRISGMFSIEYHQHCDYDRLEIQNGSSINRRCGLGIELENVYRNTNRIEIRFVSDSSMHHNNFQVTIRFSRAPFSSLQVTPLNIQKHADTTTFRWATGGSVVPMPTLNTNSLESPVSISPSHLIVH